MTGKIAYSVIISHRAEKEIIDSWNWYEERQRGLGDRFIAELLHKTSLIQKHPETYTIKHKAYREAPLTVFPVVIIYRINTTKKSIRITSVFHTARNFRNKY